MTIRTEVIRRHFPSLERRFHENTVIYADAPGGTQIPQCVTEAMTSYLLNHNANIGGRFLTSMETMDMVFQARQLVATFLNANSPSNIIFGQNMTSLTFAMSRALAQTWGPGDEIVVTNLDHDANVSPWMLAARDRNVTIRTIPCDLPEGFIKIDSLSEVISERTRLVALPYASNAIGTIPDLEPLIRLAHSHNSLVYIDAVHFAPHGLIDVQKLDCDFLACSAYKFGGPHIGILYGKTNILASLKAYKVRPSSPNSPGKWETGTQNFEAIAGLTACIKYISSIGDENEKNPEITRKSIADALDSIVEHEQTLSLAFLNRIKNCSNIHVYGITASNRLASRTPTFGLTMKSLSPSEVSRRLADDGIYIWDGHFYAVNLINQLGLSNTEGLIRIGFAHYNTLSEIDRVCSILELLSN